ncbi:MAG: LCP family protein [Elusimicrobia bacterium]|nr:LCP family protein [Elusimicrobiota bacterium]
MPAIFFCAAALELASPFIRPLVYGRPTEFLLLGIDDTGGAKRADAIFLIRLDPAFPAVKILQIPRDLLIRTEKGFSKINALMTEPASAAPLRRAPRAEIGPVAPAAAAGQLKKLFPWPCEPQRYAAVDYAAFFELALSIGEVPWLDERLGPEDSLGLVRVRDASGDFGRMGTQKAFLAAVLKKLAARPWKLASLAFHWRHLKRLADTNLNFFEFLASLVRARSFFAPAHVFFFQFPVVIDRGGGLRADEGGLRRLAPLWLAGGRGQGGQAKPGPVTMEILNASDEPGLALRIARGLRRRSDKIDVLYFGNASTGSEATFLTLRDADLGLAKEIITGLNRILGVEIAHLVAPNRRLSVQFSLLLGRNAKKSPMAQTAGPLQNL